MTTGEEEMTTEVQRLFKPLEHIADGKLYRTEGATVLAEHALGGISGWQEWYLLRTPGGAYFEQYHYAPLLDALFLAASRDEILPLTVRQAMQRYNELRTKHFTAREAFPDLEDA